MFLCWIWSSPFHQKVERKQGSILKKNLDSEKKNIKNRNLCIHPMSLKKHKKNGFFLAGLLLFFKETKYISGENFTLNFYTLVIFPVTTISPDPKTDGILDFKASFLLAKKRLF